MKGMKETTVASEDSLSLAIPPYQEKTQTWLHIKRKDLVVWFRKHA